MHVVRTSNVPGIPKVFALNNLGHVLCKVTEFARSQRFYIFCCCFMQIIIFLRTLVIPFFPKTFLKLISNYYMINQLSFFQKTCSLGMLVGISQATAFLFLSSFIIFFTSAVNTLQDNGCTRL